MKKCVLVLLALLCAAGMVFAGGSKDSGGAAASGDIVIGTILVTSGSTAYYGSEERDGIALALEQVNASGGVLGRQIKLINEDTEGDAAKAVNAFTKLTTKDGVSLIIGATLSGTSQAISTLAQQKKAVMLSPSATAPAVTDAGDYVFRACFIDPFQGTVGANFAYNTLKVRKAAVFYDAGADYNTGLADNFKAQFKKLGGQIVADEAYQTGDVDFNAQITRIKAQNPDLVYLPNYYADVALQAKQLRSQGITCPLVGGDGWDGLLENGDSSILPGYWASGFAADTQDPKGKAFADAFKAKYNRSSSQFSALGYDTFMMMVDAIKAAGSTEPAKVKDALAKTNGAYATGSIRFDEKRNPIKGTAILEIVQKDGKLVNQYKTTVNP